jgi:hypothetical protein
VEAWLARSFRSHLGIRQEGKSATDDAFCRALTRSQRRTDCVISGAIVAGQRHGPTALTTRSGRRHKRLAQRALHYLRRNQTLCPRARIEPFVKREFGCERYQLFAPCGHGLCRGRPIAVDPCLGRLADHDRRHPHSGVGELACLRGRRRSDLARFEVRPRLRRRAWANVQP